MVEFRHDKTLISFHNWCGNQKLGAWLETAHRRGDQRGPLESGWIKGFFCHHRCGGSAAQWRQQEALGRLATIRNEPRPTQGRGSSGLCPGQNVEVTGQGYEAFDDPYAYKGTSVLRNRLGIKDAAVLEAFELEMTALRAEEPLPDGRFGPAHYRKIHHHLFQDVYPWAGRYRTVRTGKSGNWFCFPEYIASAMNALFGKLKTGTLLTAQSSDNFVTEAAGFLAELNAIHPFREGNGRTQLSFLHLLALKAGHPLALDRIEPATFLTAMITSFSGDVVLLERELKKLLTA